MAIQKKNWVDQIFPYHELIRIFNFYLDLECWIISLERPVPWNPIRYHSRDSWPVELDDIFGRREARGKFNRVLFEKAAGEKRTQCGVFDGFWSFFVPILKKGKVIGVLQSGVFLKRIPKQEVFLKQWKKLTGAEPSGFDPNFSRYVKTTLETPLVTGPVYEGLRKLLELYARVAANEIDWEDARNQAEQLRKKVFARYLPNRFWVEKAVKNNRVYPPSWWLDKTRADMWRTEEQGIRRVPTIVLAVMMDEGGSGRDDLGFILRNYHFQKELVNFAKSIPETVASPLEDYGVLFFTSSDPQHTEVQEKLETLDKIDQISKFVNKRFQAKILAGVSRRQGKEENLSRVFREAVSALGFCRPLNRPILFYEDIRENPSVPKPSQFYELSKKLIDVYVNGAVHEIEPTRSHYIEQILSLSAGRPEAVRIHFLFTSGQIIDVLKKRAMVQIQKLLFLFETIERQLQEAVTLPDLIVVFRESLKRLMNLNLHPAEASQNVGMEAIRRYVDENFAEDLELEKVARDNGFSASVFTQRFKKSVGISFSAYLRKVRLEQAQKLLTDTALPIVQVSQSCGFNNLHYFFDVFKRLVGQTPQEFREAKNSKEFKKV